MGASNSKSVFSQLMADGWYVISKANPAFEGPQAVQLMDHQLVLWRSKEGLSLLRDRCVHRGARLGLGKVLENTIQCPYHGWRFKRDGGCVLIPQQPTKPIPSKAVIDCFRVTEAYGWIWGTIAENPSPLPAIDEWSHPTYRHIHCGPYDLNTYATRAVENFLDVTHLPFVHEGILGNSLHTEIHDFECRITTEGLIVDPVNIWQPNPDGQEGGTYVNYSYRATHPMHAFFTKAFDGKQFKIFLTATPTGVKSATIWMLISLDYPSPLTDQEIRDFQDRIISQDIPIIESQDPSALPLDLSLELHTKSDRATMGYRKWLSQLGVQYGVE